MGTDDLTMRYYLKEFGAGRVHGLFSVDEINERVRSGFLGPDWLATGDIGDPLETVGPYGDGDWVWLGTVPGVVGLIVRAKRLGNSRWPTVRLVLIGIEVLALISFAIAVVVFELR